MNLPVWLECGRNVRLTSSLPLTSPLSKLRQCVSLDASQPYESSRLNRELALPYLLPDFLRSSGSGTGSTQPREYARGVNGVMCSREVVYYLERNDRHCGPVVSVPGHRSRGPGSNLRATRLSEK
jgi:hypothetical protein